MPLSLDDAIKQLIRGNYTPHAYKYDNHIALSIVVDSSKQNECFPVFMKYDYNDLVVTKAQQILDETASGGSFEVQDITSTWRLNPLIINRYQQIRQALGLP